MRQVCVSKQSVHVAPGGPGAGKAHFSEDSVCSTVQRPVEYFPSLPDLEP